MILNTINRPALNTFETRFPGFKSRAAAQNADRSKPHKKPANKAVAAKAVKPGKVVRKAAPTGHGHPPDASWLRASAQLRESEKRRF